MGLRAQLERASPRRLVRRCLLDGCFSRILLDILLVIFEYVFFVAHGQALKTMYLVLAYGLLVSYPFSMFTDN
jgi:hypothetical protein